ncbi:protein S40-6-like [Curcuma longa]|uniref:protein S40-6-like n=1 Tax=Curcuma longa TaxID=136217 RepID=UPI003D9F2792
MGRMHGAGRFLASPSGFGSGVQTGRGSDLQDLYEEDVWTAFPEVSHRHLSDDDDGRWHDTSVASDIRWVHSKVGGLSLALEDSYRGTDARPLRKRRQPTFPASAPVDVPTWPKHHLPGSGGPPWETEEEEPEGDWMPPHEYLARAHGRSAATASVLEGAGRTLKGRDMSRVRDAVWSQTGFFG